MKTPTFSLLIFSLSLIATLCSYFAQVPVALASSSSAINATVTLENVSVVVSDGVVQYGTMALNSSKSTIASDLNDQQAATNNGNIPIDLNIRGENSEDWQLASSAGEDEYVHQFCKTSCSAPPTNFTALTTNYQTLEAAISPSGTQNFHLNLTTPTSSSSFSEQEVSVVVQAVAS